MKNKMMTVSETSAAIENGGFYVIAGDESALGKLPKGNWIGGTSVYFLSETGGKVDQDNLFVTEFEAMAGANTRYLSVEDLPHLAEGYQDNGASIILIPAMSAAHQAFAIDGAGYNGLFDQPLMGWVTGVHLDNLGTQSPKVFDGASGQSYEDGVVLMHLDVGVDKAADIDIINLFKQDDAGDLITFKTTGFSTTKALVNGEEVDFAAYLTDKGVDTRMPLVANYAGAMINVSFQAVDADQNKVDFYAPVIEGAEYRIAKTPGDYASEFSGLVGEGGADEFSCNCILNYLYGELEGKKTGGFTGPATFGEIAYVLLNQTMVRMSVKDIAAQNAA